jgi:hypothetical protein
MTHLALKFKLVPHVLAFLAQIMTSPEVAQSYSRKLAFFNGKLSCHHVLIRLFQ